MKLLGKTALVTGAARGIGKGCAIELARAGANVAINDLTASPEAEATVAEIRAMGREALPLTVDVRQSDQVEDAVNRCVSQFGRLDMLVNNAGGFFVVPTLEISDNGFDAVIRINLKSTFVCCKAVASAMRQQGKGSILNIASASGEHASPSMAHYGAAKAGIINLTQTLAVEWAPQIRVNAIAPGAIATPGTSFIWEDPSLRAQVEKGIPLARYGQPEDIAAAALYLLSDAADYVTGHILDVNGGPQVPSYLTARP